MKYEIRNLRILFPILGLFLLALSSIAADVQMSIEPQLISLLDRAVLKVEFINASGKALDIPPVDGLNIQYRGQSSETSIVNMRRTTKVVHTYLITPSKIGDFTIGPVTAHYKGGAKELSAQLRVIKPSDDKEAQAISELMYSQISSDLDAPHVHEPFGLTLRYLSVMAFNRRKFRHSRRHARKWNGRRLTVGSHDP